MATIERLLHVLLWAHPATTRKRYGDAIVQTILERVSHANGKLAASTLLLRECIGIVVSGARARRERARQGRKTAPRRRTPLFAEKAVDWFHDVRIASRSLWRRPWFSLPAILALALGVAAAVAIFSVFHAILLRPLPFAEPDRLVSIWEKNPERGWHKAQVAGANYLDWRSEASTFADMAAHNDWLDQRVLLEGGEPTIVLASEVTGNFFDVLGVPPLEGRPFDDAHTWAGLEPVVVLSQRFWSRHFGEDATVVGRAIELDGVAHRVLGIMPGTFGYPFREADLWVPVAWDPALLGEVRFRRAHGMRVVVRLAPGVFQVLTRQGRRLHMGWNLSGELIDLVLMFIMWSVMMVAMMVSTSPLLGGGLLIAAGVFQWTPLKRARLVHCRSPLHFFMTEWRDGASGAVVMNLLWVAAIAAFVLIEKMVPRGAIVGRTFGVALIGAGMTMVGGIF